jgi:hypothetical protein
LTNQIEQVIEDNIPQKANASWECQKLTMLNALSEFEYTINGLQKEDLIEREDW